MSPFNESGIYFVMIQKGMTNDKEKTDRRGRKGVRAEVRHC